MTINNEVKILGKNLKKVRIKKGLSKSRLARKANININTLSRLENGIGNPLISTLYRLSLALKTKLYILCNGI